MPFPEVLLFHATSVVAKGGSSEGCDSPGDFIRCTPALCRQLSPRSMRLRWLCAALFHVTAVWSTELTFELPDNERQCFYEELESEVKFNFDFQVSFPFQKVGLYSSIYFGDSTF